MKYFGFIERIDEEFASCILHQDDMPLFKYILDIPIDKIDKQHLNIGEVFYINAPISIDYKIEWLPEIPPTKEDLDKIDENMAKFLKLFDE